MAKEVFMQPAKRTTPKHKDNILGCIIALNQMETS